MLKNFDIYLSRLISALCLFMILAEANLWLNPLNNIILVLGYRLFILFTPILFLFFKHRLTFLAFIFAEFGILFWLTHYPLLGTILFCIGISISGYMLKFYSSFSARGAAGNKIALNLGSIFSGILVSATQNFYLLLIFSFAAMLTSFFSFTHYYHREKIYQFKSSTSSFNIKRIFTKSGIAWAMIGFITGVKLISIVSVLPQFIISTHHGKLPAWYGYMLILNSIIVVSLQIPIMNKIQHFNKIIALIPLAIAMIIIMFSASIGISSFTSALCWTISLSLIECAISYLDKLSQDDGVLLIKEATVGIGCAACVFCVRYFDLAQASFFIGFLSLILLIISMLLFYSEFKLKHSQKILLASYK